MIVKKILHYDILEVISEGGMGIVYKARDHLLDRLVAIKCLPHLLTSDEKLIAQFIQEARAVARLDHPNICTIHEFEKIEKNQYALVMAYYDGDVLKQLLSSRRGFTVEQFIDISIQIAKGLDFAHKAGIIHRDIKPANIIVSDKGIVTILDFGLARLKADLSRTDGFAMSGTIGYMSPEQTIGNEIDQRTDIWSLGVLMHEILSGQKPFSGDHEQSQIYSILKEDPPALQLESNDLHDRLKLIIHKCLQKEPNQRYQRADQIVKELEKCREAENLPRYKKKQITRDILTMVALVTFLLLILIVSFMKYPDSMPVDSNYSIRIAVMPFDNPGPNQVEKWLSKGITGEIRARLSKIEHFRILSGSVWDETTLQYAGISEIANMLDVDYIIGGKVGNLDQQLEISALVFNTSTKKPIWSDNYICDTTETLEAIQNISWQISTALQVELSNPEKDHISKSSTHTQRAIYYYLRGLDYQHSSNLINNDRAIELFNHALKQDPECALAYVGLSNSYRLRVWSYSYPPVWLDSALSMAQEALKIDPNCSDAYVALGRIYNQEIYMGPDSLPVALAAFQKAIELNSSNYEALVYLGQLKFQIGIPQEALSYLNQSLELNPFSFETHEGLAWTHYLLGDTLKAAMHYEEAQKIAPENIFGMYRIYIQEEQYDKAIPIMMKALKIDPREWVKHDLATILKNAGDYQGSVKLYREIIKENPEQGWHYIGLANAFTEQDLFSEALHVYSTYDMMLDTCSGCSSSLMIAFNYSLLLNRLGKSDMARKVIINALNNPRIKLYGFHDSMLRIIDFFLGTISADSIEHVMRVASQKLQRQSYFLSHYNYLGLAYLHNLKPGYILTPAYREKAIAYLKMYESKGTKRDVEFSLARVELKRLGALN